MDITYRWYTRPGVPYPLREERGIVNGREVYVSQAFDDGTDTDITEAQYDTDLAAHNASILALRQSNRSDKQNAMANQRSVRASAKGKLMSGTPLSDEESDVVLSGLGVP